MNRRKTLAILALSLFTATLFTVFFTRVNASMTPPITISTPSYDGHILYTGTYTRTTNFQFVRLDADAVYRAFIKFDTSTITDNSSVSRVDLRIYCDTGVDDGVKIWSMENDPESASDATVYADAADGDTYYTISDIDAGNWYNVTLSSDASTDLEGLLGSDYFAVGLEGTTNDVAEIASMEDADGFYAQLIVYYTNTNYVYTFYGKYGENGTHLNSVNITAHADDGTNEFEVDGSRIVGFDRRQTMFSFDLDASTQRVFYVTSNNETFQIFQPETTYETYGITIYDYTGKLGEGSTYLEAYRTVNASEYLVERRIIFDSFNEVPMTLAEGKIYRLQILWSDNTTYDWGYFIPGVDLTPTLVLSKLTFSQRAQMTYKYLSIEATRQNATWIRVNYQDDTPTGYETGWCNITVTYRNGTVITTYNGTAETISWNWYSADNETDYWVLAEIDHTFWGIILEYSKLLDADLSYSAFPNLNILGTLGGLNTANTLSAVIVLCIFGVGSRKNVDVALIAGFSVAGMLRILGANTWSWDLLAFGFALSIAYAVYRGRVRP